MTTENEAFANVMLPGEGEVTREELEKVKASIGRLWFSLWSCRRNMNSENNDWGEKIVGLMEACGGIDAFREKWTEIKRKKLHIFTDDQKLGIVKGVKCYLDHTFVEKANIGNAVVSIGRIVDDTEECGIEFAMTAILQCLGATEEEIEDKSWKEKISES